MGGTETITSIERFRRTRFFESLCLDANADDRCIGLIAWMHTFSPAKMWIAGLDALPGSLLAREAHGGRTPGAGRIRMALVAGIDECVEAAERIVAYTKALPP